MEIDTHIRQLQGLLDELRGQASVKVADVIVDPLYSQLKHQGIYEIREPEDVQTVYIGKTTVARGGVAQRIWDHAYQVSDLVDTLKVTRQMFACYRVRSLAVTDPHLRGLAEYFAIAVCDPPGNHVEG